MRIKSRRPHAQILNLLGVPDKAVESPARSLRNHLIPLTCGIMQAPTSDTKEAELAKHQMDKAK